MASINGLYVYTYQHDDDQRGWIPLEAFTSRWTGSHETETAFSPAFIEKVTTTIKQCGWEGDGKFGAMLVPPFFSSAGDNYWFPIIHIKQEHRGISWIISEYPLGTENLRAESVS